jgi:hypothetical protein
MTQVPGKLPGDYCPCGDGLLVPRFKSERISNGIRGPSGYSYVKNNIQDLACNICSQVFACNLRGTELLGHLHRQIEKLGLKAGHGAGEPSCTSCGQTKFIEMRYSAEHPRGVGENRPQMEQDHYQRSARPYRYCPDCLTVWWVGRTDSELNPLPPIKLNPEDEVVLRTIPRVRRSA